jgi:hypothetical protein
MNIKTYGVVSAFVIGLWAAPASADMAELDEMTRDMIKDAVSYFQEEGFDAAKEAFSDPDAERWFKQPHSVHMFGAYADGEIWADNAFPEFVGSNFNDLSDANGKRFGSMVMKNAEVGEPYRIDFVFLHPKKDTLADGAGHCQKPNPDHVLCSFGELD